MREDDLFRPKPPKPPPAESKAEPPADPPLVDDTLRGLIEKAKMRGTEWQRGKIDGADKMLQVAREHPDNPIPYMMAALRKWCTSP